MLRDLPADVLIRIFNGVDYMTLKFSLPSVCRDFDALINETDQLATALFRGSGADATPRYMPLVKKTECDIKIASGSSASVAFALVLRATLPETPGVTVHPCFSLLRVRRRANKEIRMVLTSDDVGFYKGSGNFTPFHQTSVVYDYATSPARDQLGFSLHFSGSEKYMPFLSVARPVSCGRRGPVTFHQVIETFIGRINTASLVPGPLGAIDRLVDGQRLFSRLERVEILRLLPEGADGEWCIGIKMHVNAGI